LHVPEYINLQVAITSTVLALLAIGLSWVLYGRKSVTFDQADPLKRLLGPIFTGMENKWWIDELYWAVILNPYIAISRFTADVIDWRFWHDWFHDRVIADSFQWLSRTFLDSWFDQRGIDGFANGLADGTKELAQRLRGIQTGFVRNYALSVFIGVVVILGYLILQ
jgi:NADH-quinone oxidoreductase subunit L